MKAGASLNLRMICRVLVICAIAAPIPAWADLYQASAAADRQDFPRAFELFRELAETGQPVAQENLAVMYVNGEGVKRDNVLGYAWASMAIENGGSEAAKSIVAQLEPHLNDAARARVAELKSRFGKEALEQSLLIPRPNSPPPPTECTIVSVVDPHDFYPKEARNRGISGDVLIEQVVFSDGRAHDPRSLHSFPPDVFSVAGRYVALYNRSKPKRVNGVVEPCSFKFKIKFSAQSGGQKDTVKDQIGATRERAKGGDPMAQLAYALVIDHRPDLAEKDDAAIWWYLKAAQAGIPAAQHIVGSHLLGGKSEAKGLIWLNKAAAAGNPEAQLDLANYYARHVPDAAALASASDWFGKAVAGGSRDARYYFAALLATAPDAAIRDPAQALLLIEQAGYDYGMNPTWSEIKAAALAQAGDFETAQKEQEKAVRLAKKLGWKTAPQESRLADYAAGKAWTGDLFAFY